MREGRMIKTISLDPHTYQLASKKPNFSAWVRELLIKDEQALTHTHATLAIFKEKGLCNPVASPRCGICFPWGNPDRLDIRNYNIGNITAEQLQMKTKELHKETLQLQMIKIEEKEALAPVVKERKYIRRLLKAIWQFI